MLGEVLAAAGEDAGAPGRVCAREVLGLRVCVCAKRWGCSAVLGVTGEAPERELTCEGVVEAVCVYTGVFGGVSWVIKWFW